MGLQLHQRERSEASLSDEYETPKVELFEFLCNKYNFHPKLDVCATKENSKCMVYFDKEFNALEKDWLSHHSNELWDVWCNPPHTMTQEFVIKAYEQWIKFGMGIMMIIPANSMCTKYAEKYIEGSAEYHPIFFRPTFLVNGTKSKFNARNGYFVIIWRKRLN